MGRIIKRYENRKLYDTEACRYVSLEELAALIREGANVQVIDKATEEDISAQTLTQIILQEGKKGNNPLSTDILHNVIRVGNDLLSGGLQQARQAMAPIIPNAVSRIFSNESPDELGQLKKRVELLESVINTLVKQQDSKEEK